MHTAGGSSGGEAALVGSGSSALGLGNDILGSIRIPASFNSVVGFKPASFTVPKDGIWPDLSGHFVDSPRCRPDHARYATYASSTTSLPMPLYPIRNLSTVCA